MIRLVNIEKEYDFRNQKIIVLDKVNVEFDYGKMYVIMGHSGSGKSTLLHLIGLLDSPTAGEIIFDKTRLEQLSNIDKDNMRALKIGYVFQDFYLNSKLTAYENILLPMLINKNIRKQDRVTVGENLLKLVGLEKVKNKYPKELSGGEQQRVAIARALANNPKIILADEPTANLDSKNEIFILDLLKKLKKDGKCIIVASHNHIIKKYAEEVMYLEDGRIVKKEKVEKGKKNEIKG